MIEGLLSLPLKCLNKLGLLVPNSIKTTILLTFWQLLYLCEITAAILQYSHMEHDIFEIINNTVAVFAFVQGYSKFTFTIFFKSKLLNFIQLTQSFWNLDNCSKDTKKEVNELTAKIIFIQKLFLYGCYSIATILILSPFFLNIPLPLGSWKMTNYNELYKVMYITNSLCLLINVTICCGIDLLFLGMCYEIIIQFKIFCDHLAQMSVEFIETEEDLKDQYEQFKTYFEHHKRLLKFVKEMQNCYSFIFMVQYLTTAPIVCSVLYATFESKSILLAFEFGIICLLATAQIAFYCIAAEYVTHEVLTVSDGIYNSDWYSKHYMKLKKSTILMIQQGQQEVRFTACGLIDINIATLIATLQFAFSTSTFLRSLNK